MQNNTIDKGEVISDHNEKFLIEFERHLTKNGKSPRTIQRYLNQLSLYLTHYLGFREHTKAEDASMGQIPSYFDYFVMHKCLWSTKTAIQDGFSALR